MTGLHDVFLGSEAAPSVAAPGLLRRVRHSDCSFTIDSNEELGLVISLSETHSVERRLEGRVSRQSPRVGSLTLLPPGVRTHFKISGSARALLIKLPVECVRLWLAEDHGIDADQLDFQPRLHFDDPTLARLVYAMAMVDSDRHEANAREVATRLLKGHTPRAHQTQPTHRSAGLPSARLRRVLDCIDCRIADTLTLRDLAREAGMSPFHFAREFRRVVGTSPIDYLIRRRVDHAVSMLAREGLSVAAVAEASGFAHSSHLSRHLKRITGLSPVDFRKHVLP